MVRISITLALVFAVAATAFSVALPESTKTVSETTKSPTTTVPETTKSLTTTVPETTKSPTTTVPETTNSPTTTVPETTKSPTTTVPETTISPTTTVPETTKSPTTTVPEITKSPTTTVPETTKSPTTTFPETTKSPITAVPEFTKSPTTTFPETSKSLTTTVPETSKSPTTTVPETTKSPTTTFPETTKSPITAVPEFTKSPTTTFPETTKSLTTTVPETSKSPTEDPNIGGEVDFAEIQNAEDDAEQFQADCSSGEEYIRHPGKCGRFYQCSNGIPYLTRCPAGLYFDLTTKVCDYPHNVNCKNAADRCTFRRIGLSSRHVSSASCPEGSVPVSCSSTNTRNSDGNYITGRDCHAINSARGDGQRAVAVCVNVADEDEYVFKTSGDFKPEPVASCPVNYRVVNCLLINIWSYSRYVFAQIRPGRDACYSDIPCTAGQGCSVQAICRRRNYPVAAPVLY